MLSFWLLYTRCTFSTFFASKYFLSVKGKFNRGWVGNNWYVFFGVNVIVVALGVIFSVLACNFVIRFLFSCSICRYIYVSFIKLEIHLVEYGRRSRLNLYPCYRFDPFD